MSASAGGGSQSASSQDAVLASVRSAVVFADAGAADWINWCRLLPRLIEHGALAVREFHPREKLSPGGSSPIRKAVFLLAGQLDEPVAMETLAELVANTGLNYVIVLAGACPEASVCADVEERLAGWMGHGATAQVRFVPLGHVTLIHADGGSSEPEFVVLGGCPGDSRQLVRSLHSLLCEMSLREDLFCLGQASCRLGDALAAYGPAKERRRLANQRRAALLLVDRALDLVGPLSFLADSWLDSLYRAGKPLLLTDVQVDMTAFTRSRCPAYVPIGSLSGCLDSPLGRRLAADAAGKTSKAAAAAVQRAVADAMTAERVAFDPSLLIAASSGDAGLGRLLERLAAGRPDLAFTGRHAAVVQLAVAVGQAVATAGEERRRSEQPQRARIEKSLIGAAAGPPEDLADQLAALDDAGVADGLDADCLLALKVIGWSLQLPPQQQQLSVDRRAVGDSSSINDATVRSGLMGARAAQPRLRLCDCSVVPTYSPLIGQLAADIFSATAASSANSQQASLQYAHKSTGLSGIFGYLGVTSKPKPSDSGLVLVCLVGGCTWSEHRVLRERLRQAAAGGGSKRVVLVTDRLIRGRDELIGSLRRGDLF